MLGGESPREEETEIVMGPVQVVRLEKIDIFSSDRSYFCHDALLYRYFIDTPNFLDFEHFGQNTWTFFLIDNDNLIY